MRTELLNGNQQVQVHTQKVGNIDEPTIRVDVRASFYLRRTGLGRRAIRTPNMGSSRCDKYCRRAASNRDKALYYLARAVDIDPSSAAARFQLGAALEDVGDAPSAVREYKRAISLDPSLGAARCNYGQILEEMRDLLGAERQYKAATTKDPSERGRAHAHVIYGRFLESKRNDLDGAENQYRLAMSVVPGFLPAKRAYNVLVSEVALRNMDGSLVRRPLPLWDYPDDDYF